MRLGWITNPHFNFLPPFGAHAFAQYAAKETACDAVVLTGDMASSQDFIPSMMLLLDQEAEIDNSAL